VQRYGRNPLWVAPEGEPGKGRGTMETPESVIFAFPPVQNS
jgi:hypothetical protein